MYSIGFETGILIVKDFTFVSQLLSILGEASGKNVYSSTNYGNNQ